MDTATPVLEQCRIHSFPNLAAAYELIRWCVIGARTDPIARAAGEKRPMTAEKDNHGWHDFSNCCRLFGHPSPPPRGYSHIFFGAVQHPLLSDLAAAYELLCWCVMGARTDPMARAAGEKRPMTAEKDNSLYI